MLAGAESPNRRWNASYSEFISQGSFADQVQVETLFKNPRLQTAQFAWNLHSTFTQSLKIDPSESPLYRLQSDFQFQANAIGAIAPIDVHSVIYDPHVDAEPPQFMWSVMTDDVDRINQVVPDLANRVVTMTVQLEVDSNGHYKPVDLNAGFTLTSRHDFLNDSSEFNYELDGVVSYDFSNSAELLGVLFRDEFGNVATDVLVSSATGINYRVLAAIPEPASWATMLAGLALFAWVRGRQPRPASA